MVFALVFNRFQPAPNSKVPGSGPNPRVQIFPPEYLGSYALYKVGVFGTFVCFIMFQDKNRVVAPPVTPKRRDGGQTQNLMFILKFIRIFNLNSKINLKITVELKMFIHFVNFLLNWNIFL
jgi:hypothetical protein